MPCSLITHMLKVSWASHQYQFSSAETWFSHLLQLFPTSSCKHVLQTPTGSSVALLCSNPSELFSCCCINKLPQTWWLPITQILSYGSEVGRSVFLLEAWGENLFARLFQLLEAACIPWCMTPFLHLQATSSLSHIPMLIPTLLPSPTFQDSCGDIGLNG